MASPHRSVLNSDAMLRRLGIQRRASAPRVVATMRPWPELMSAKTASEFVDEPSARAFRRKVGSIYPAPAHGNGKAAKWRRSDLDRAIAAMQPSPQTVFDAASVL